jgi:hypothetical protein
MKTLAFRAEKYTVLGHDHKSKKERALALSKGILTELDIPFLRGASGMITWKWNLGKYQLFLDDKNETINILSSIGPFGMKTFQGNFSWNSSVEMYYEYFLTALGFEYRYSIESGKETGVSQASIDKILAPNEEVLAKSEHYFVTNIFEDAFLKAKTGKVLATLGSYYGDPQAAIIDSTESFCAVVGHDTLLIYQIRTREKVLCAVPAEWVYYLIEKEGKIVLRQENCSVKTFYPNDYFGKNRKLYEIKK